MTRGLTLTAPEAIMARAVGYLSKQKYLDILHNLETNFAINNINSIIGWNFKFEQRNLKDDPLYHYNY